MSRKSTRIVTAATLALLLLVPLLIEGGGVGRGSGLAGSARSRRDAGRAGARLLLHELGLDARIFERPPATLPDLPGLVWLARVPAHDPGDSRGLTKPDDPGAALGPAHSARNYLRFVKLGGTLVLPAVEGARTWLVTHLGLAALGKLLETGREGEAVPTTVRGPFPGELRVEWGSADPFREACADARNEALLSAADGRVLALRRRVRAGSLVLLGDDRFADNERLGREDNAELVVRLAESLVDDAPVLFDEYALGSWRPAGKLELAFGPRFVAISLQVLLVLAAFLWRQAWARAFPHEVPAVAAVSPVARAQALVSLYQRAGRLDLLAARAETGRPGRPGRPRSGDPDA